MLFKRKTAEDTNENKRPKRKKNKLILGALVPFQVVIAILICMALLIYGPFETIRDYIIGTAMSTSTHQYLATMFFPKKQIEKVLSAGSAVKAQAQDLSGLDSVSGSSSSKVTMEEISSSSGKYNGYLLEIANPLRVKLAYTQYLGVRGETTTEFAKDHGALAAINGGGFEYYVPTVSSSYPFTGMAIPQAISNGSMPSDFVISGGKVVWENPVYSETNPDQSCAIALDQKGTLIVGRRTISDLLKLKVQYAVTMPGYEPLIVNGKGTYSDDKQTMGYSGAQPRTVIGQKADKTILMLVVSGRSMPSIGATVADVTQIMLDHGAVTAANLDGGYSSSMIYNGKAINQSSADYGERTVPTAFYVTK
jgi:exopolysaccharide biosynthesis protein